MKYDSVHQAMQTDEGKKLYDLLSLSFQVAMEITSPRITEVMHRSTCYVGSTHHLEKLTWDILNSLNRDGVK